MATKYLGCVYVLALALGCPLVLFPLQFTEGSCHLAQVCWSSAPLSSRLGASCGLTSSMSPRVNCIRVIHFTEWGKRSSERLLT